MKESNTKMMVMMAMTNEGTYIVWIGSDEIRGRYRYI